MLMHHRPRRSSQWCYPASRWSSPGHPADFGPEPFLDNRSLLHILNQAVTSPANATAVSTGD